MKGAILRNGWYRVNDYQPTYFYNNNIIVYSRINAIKFRRGTRNFFYDQILYYKIIIIIFFFQ